LLNNPQLNGSLFFGSPISIAKQARLYPEDKPLEFDGADIEIIHTPGHTPGSVSLKVNGWLFSGDTLFFDSIGRTDIPLASSEALISSIQEKLMSLPSDLKVYPGHGETTTIEREKKHNPFLEGQSL